MRRLVLYSLGVLVSTTSAGRRCYVFSTLSVEPLFPHPTYCQEFSWTVVHESVIWMLILLYKLLPSKGSFSYMKWLLFLKKFWSFWHFLLSLGKLITFGELLLTGVGTIYMGVLPCSASQRQESVDSWSWDWQLCVNSCGRQICTLKWQAVDSRQYIHACSPCLFTQPATTWHDWGWTYFVCVQL